ncbi:uncharacterized protein LOC112048126 [Bicyclus anynana]|uniref:Uncharacterized protein LOC112048126 n=1 Tax=Bicyclus anynana TaxID=110368 RepID=A0ABM3M6G4_BICAN|nr:uncharacterized protein LOC112048126 [Bicyclus anynana]
MPVQPAEELDSLIPILDGFHMPVQPAEELDWSHAPSCAFPDPFGSIDDFIIEDEYEEDSIEDIIGALDNIILARPRSEVELKIEGCQFIDVDIYTFAVTNDAAFMSDDSSDEDQSTPDCSSDEESS